MARGEHSEVLQERRTAPPPPRRSVGPPPAPVRSRRLKYALDKLVAAGGLIVTAPVFLAVALALRLTGPRRVLVRRERVGEGGRPMVVRAFAVPGDGSWVWRLLAAMGVSALPQLWSVLRGELSVVGPRPREPGDEPPPARPGLTGLAQLAQLDGWPSLSERLALDAEYARTWSLRLDAWIVWRTALSSLGRRTPRRP